MAFVAGTSRRWSKRREFDELSATLATTDGRDFEREALKLLRVIWPEALPAPRLRSFDRAGADHLVWSDEPLLPLVVQYKGFVSADHELGPSHIQQCVKSIRVFARSGLRTSHYVLIHNRDGRSRPFREAIHAELEKLKETGAALSAELMDRQAFVLRAFQAMEVRVFDAIERRSRRARDAEEERISTGTSVVDRVPLRDGTFVADQNQRLSIKPGGLQLADAAELLQSLHERGPTTTLLIGQAGFGKTTAALRAWAAKPRATFYVAAAQLSKDIRGTKDFALACVPDDLFDEMDDLNPEDRELHRFMSRAVFVSLFAREDLEVVLFIDGLDESVFFARTEGLHHLFNILREIRIPVLLTARSEMWHSRQHDFATSVGAVNLHTRRRHEVRIIELLPWGADEVETLVTATANREADIGRRNRLKRFAEALANGSAHRRYGDLLNRPLFVRMILETVATRDDIVDGTVSRARLVEDWVRLKIVRDVAEPLRHGRDRRIELLPGIASIDETVRVAFQVMAQAAALMIERLPTEVALTADCELAVLLSALGHSPRSDPLGISLHTLLVPVEGRTATQSVRLRFAHVFCRSTSSRGTRSISRRQTGNHCPRL